MKTLLLCVSCKFRYLTKYFAQISLQSPVWSCPVAVAPWDTNMAAVKCQDLELTLAIYTRLQIICTEQKSVYIRTFLIFHLLNRLKISIVKRVLSFMSPTYIYQNALVSRRGKLLNLKVLNRHKFTPSYA